MFILLLSSQNTRKDSIELPNTKGKSLYRHKNSIVITSVWRYYIRIICIDLWLFFLVDESITKIYRILGVENDDVNFIDKFRWFLFSIARLWVCAGVLIVQLRVPLRIRYGLNEAYRTKKRLSSTMYLKILWFCACYWSRQRKQKKKQTNKKKIKIQSNSNRVSNDRWHDICHLIWVIPAFNRISPYLCYYYVEFYRICMDII